MNNDNTNTNNNSNEEFVLDFDDDVVDLTDSHRKNTNSYNSNISNSYNSDSYNSGSYNSNNYNSNYNSDSYNSGSYNSNNYNYNSNYNSNSYNTNNYNSDFNSDYSSGYNNFSGNYDPYGAYNPNRDLSLSNNAEKVINNTYKNDLNITFKLVIIAMIAIIAHLAYLAFSKNPFTASQYYLWAINLITEVAFISDAIVLKAKTGKTSPIIVAVFLYIFYPLISFSKRGLSKAIPLLWIILSISFTGKFISNQYHILTTNPEYTKSSADHYDSKYDKPVKKLNAMKASSTSKKTVNDIIKDYFSNTSWDAKTNDDGSYSISVQGDAHDKVNGEEVIYKVKIGFTLSKSLDSYSVTSVSINSTQYNSQSQVQSFWNELVAGH